MICVHLSDRGIPLVWTRGPLDTPVLTVENYLKWYSLYLVMPQGDVQTVDFDALDEISGRAAEAKYQTPYVDHAPNPHVVMRLAYNSRWHLDEQALEMIIGRWEREARDGYYPEEG